LISAELKLGVSRKDAKYRKARKLKLDKYTE